MAVDMNKPIDQLTDAELDELERIKSYGQQPAAPAAPAAPVQAQPPSVPSPEIQQTKQQAPIPAAEPPQSPGMMSRAYDALAPIIPFSGRGLSFAGDGVTSRIVRGGHQAMKAVDKFLAPDGGAPPEEQPKFGQPGFPTRVAENAARGAARAIKGIPEFLGAELPARLAAGAMEPGTSAGGGSRSPDALDVAGNVVRGAFYDAPRAAAEMVVDPLARLAADYTPLPGHGFVENATEQFARNPTGIIEQGYFPAVMLKHGLAPGKGRAGPGVRYFTAPVEAAAGLAKRGVSAAPEAVGAAVRGMTADLGGPQVFDAAGQMVRGAFPTFAAGAEGMVDAFRQRRPGQNVTPIPTTDPYAEGLDPVPFGDVREASPYQMPPRQAGTLGAFDPSTSARYAPPVAQFEPVPEPKEYGPEPKPDYPLLPPAPVPLPEVKMGKRARVREMQKQEAQAQQSRQRELRREYPGTENFEFTPPVDRASQLKVPERDWASEGARPPAPPEAPAPAAPPKRQAPVKQKAAPPPAPIQPPPQEPLMSGQTDPGEWSAPERPAESQVNSGGKRSLKKGGASFDPQAFWSNAEKYGSPAEKARVARLRRAVEADTADAYSAATAGMSAADLSAVQSLRNSMERSKPKGTPPAPTADVADAPMPGWMRENFDALAEHAERTGVADKIEAEAANRLTAKQIAQKLGIEPDVVSAVRMKRNIPSMSRGSGGMFGPAEGENPDFTKWAEARRQKVSAPFPEAPAQTGAQADKKLHLWGAQAFRAFVKTGQVPKKFARLKGTPAFDQGWSKAEGRAKSVPKPK